MSAFKLPQSIVGSKAPAPTTKVKFGFQLPSSIVQTKTATPSSKPNEKYGDVVVRNFPAHPQDPNKTSLLTRGQYYSKVGSPNEMVQPEREKTYGSLFTKPGQERDHIFSWALGGTSNDPNMQYLEGANWWDRTFVKDPFAQKSRQQGKMVIELKAIEDYQAGRISLPEARLREINWDKYPDSLVSYFGKSFLDPDTYKETGRAVGGMLANFGKAMLHSATTIGKAYKNRPLPQIAQENIKSGIDFSMNVGKRFVAPGARDVAGTAESFAGFGEWVGVPGAKTTADFFSVWKEELAKEVKDPDSFITQLGGGAGSAALFFLPGLGAVKLTNAITRFSPAVARGVGVGVSTFLESSAEAGDTYRTSLKLQPEFPELADARANFVFWSNASLNYLTNRLGVFSDTGKSVLAKILSATPEGVQEFAQTMIQNKAFDKPLTDHALRAGMIGGIIGLFTGGLGGVSPHVVPQEVQEELKKIPEFPTLPPPPPPSGSIKEQPKFKTTETPDVTSRSIQQLEGKGTVSRQFVEDLIKQQGMTQAERDIIQEALKDEGNIVSAPRFIEKVRGNLLPLKRSSLVKNKITTKYSGIVLPEDLRGEVDRYDENVYESPIPAPIAAQKHFGETLFPNYFAHTRVEDTEPGVRRIIEIQSDLAQKGTIEDEKKLASRISTPLKGETAAQLKQRRALAQQQTDKQFARLEPYRNTWWQRVVREEVKRAAKEEMKTLQIPTGETAMKIEGLGDFSHWSIAGEGRYGTQATLTVEKLKIGKEVLQGNNKWIITDVLGDGKFKAVTKDTVEANGRKIPLENISESRKETFDISGKVDTDSPIYRFYEKEIGRFLKNQYGAKLVTDKQGVTWWQFGVPAGAAENPVPAFKEVSAPVKLITAEEARKEAQEILRNAGVSGVLFDFVDAIYTGEVKNGRRVEAYGVTYDNTITFADFVAEFAGQHEAMHIIFRNLDVLKNFGGITKQGILQELSNKYPGVPVEELEEKLAEDYELYLEQNMNKEEATKTFGQKIAEFFERLTNTLKQLFGVGEELNLIGDLYARATFGKSEHVTEIQHRGDLEAFRRKDDDKIVLDFANRTQKSSDQAIFKRSKEQNKIESLTGKIENIKEKASRETRKQELGTLRSGVKLRIKLQDKINEIKEKQSKLVANIKDKQRNIDETKKEIFQFARNVLPPKSRGKLLPTLANAQTPATVSKALRLIIQESNTVRQKELMSAIKEILEKVPALPLRYQYLVGNELKGISSVAMTEKTRRELITLRNLVSNNPEVIAEFGPDGVRQLKRLGELEATPLKALPIDELAKIADNVVTLEVEGRVFKELREEQKIRQRELTLGILKQTSKNIDHEKPRIVARELTKQEEREQAKALLIQDVQNGKMNYYSVDLGFEILDGHNRFGNNWKIFKSPFDTVYDTFQDHKNTFLQHYFNTKTALEKHFGMQYKKHHMERIMIHATKAQLGGNQKLLSSDYTQDLIDSVELTPAEDALYRYMRKNFDGIRPLIDSTLQQVYDRKLDPVENYFSWQTDFENSNEVYQRLENDYSLTSRTAQGFTKSRTYNGRQTIKLDAEEVYLKHIQDSLYFHHTEAVLNEAGMIARSPEYAKAVGKHGQRWVVGWIDLMARKGIPKGWKPNLVTKALNNIGAGILGFKLSPILKQPLAKITSASLLGMDAVKHDPEFYHNKLWVDVMEASRQQKFRNFDDPAYTERKQSGKLMAWQERGYMFIKALDTITANSVWYAAYKKWHDINGIDFSLDSFKAGNYEQEAVAYADYVTRRTQGSSEAKDMARIMTAENRNFWRSILKFQNFVMNESYLVLHDLPVDVRKGNWGETSSIVTAYLIAGIAETYITSAMIALFSGDADREEEEFKRSIWNRILDSMIGRIPLVNNIYGTFKYDSSGVALLDTYLNAVKGTRTLFTGKETLTKVGGAVRGSEAIASLVGIPGSSQAGQIIRLLLSQFSEETKTLKMLEHLESLQGDDADEAWTILKQEDELMYDRVKKLAEEKILGITQEDRDLKAMGVKNGDRARAIMQEMDKLPTREQKAALWDEYRNKKIISDEVADQLRPLLTE